MESETPVFSTEFKYAGRTYIVCCLDEGDYIFSIIDKSKTFYEDDLLNLLGRIPLKAGVVIDAGANIGNHTLFFAKALGRKTLAFEPSSHNFRALQETARRNGLLADGRVLLFKQALGEKTETGTLLLHASNSGMGRIQEGIAGAKDGRDFSTEEVEIALLDDRIDLSEPVALIKIDVEGYETNVLRGAQQLLQKHFPLLTLECHTQEALSAIDKVLWPLDYRPVASAGRSFNCVYCHVSDYEKISQYADIAQRWSAQKASEAGSIRLAVTAEKTKAERSLAERNQAQQEVARLTSERTKLQETFKERVALLDSARSTADRLKAERDAALADLQAARKALKAQTLERDRFKSDLADAQRRRQRDEDLRAETERELERLKELLDTADGENARLLAQLNELEEQRDAFRRQAARREEEYKEFESLKARLSAAEAATRDTETRHSDAQATIGELRAERDRARSDGEGLAKRLQTMQTAYEDRNALLTRARAAAETLREERNAYAALSQKRGVAVRGLSNLAIRLARNDISRAAVLRTVPPGLRRAITSRLFPAPVVQRAPLPPVREPATIIDQKPAAVPVPAPPSVPAPRQKTGKVEFDVMVVCNAYPGGPRAYGGEFVKSRVDAYRRQGLKPLVLEASNMLKEERRDDSGGVPCLRMPELDFSYKLKSLKERCERLVVHSPSPDMIHAIASEVEDERCLYWFHGFEIRDYRRLYFNYTTEQLEKLRETLDGVNAKRFAAARICFSQHASRKIFVSEFIRSVAERDVGATPLNAHIIPNFIDGDFYAFNQKTPEMAKRILLIRSFHARNYANDIAVDAIRHLSSRPGFEDFAFTIRGFGAGFDALTAPLAGLVNVDVKEGHLSPEEMRELHATHGLFLAPSRFDTQGVTMGEAMASGLVCVTNSVAAIPEFADDNCARLVRPDDPRSYAEAIWDLAHNPQQVPGLSDAAGKRVRAQCGGDQTIKRELALIAA